MSERSLAIPPALASLAERLSGRRPLLWLVAGGVAAAVLVTVRSRLAEAEASATVNGYALAVGEPTPAAAEAAWAGTLAGKPIVLAPVSAVARAAQANAR